MKNEKSQSNKYFLNLESHNKAKSSVSNDFHQGRSLVADPKKVMGEIENFYSNLYQKDDLDLSENLSSFFFFLRSSQIPKLPVEKRKASDGKLIIDE